MSEAWLRWLPCEFTFGRRQRESTSCTSLSHEMLNGSRIFRKKLALVLLAVVCVPFTFIMLQRDDSNNSIITTSNYWEKLFLEKKFSGGTHLEEELTSEIAHLRQRVSQVEMINQARRRDLALLTQHVNRSLPLIWSKLPALSIVFLIISHFHFFP